MSERHRSFYKQEESTKNLSSSEKAFLAATVLSAILGVGALARCSEILDSLEIEANNGHLLIETDQFYVGFWPDHTYIEAFSRHITGWPTNNAIYRFTDISGSSFFYCELGKNLIPNCGEINPFD